MNKEGIKKLTPYILPLALLVIDVLFIWKYYYLFIDSDAASNILYSSEMLKTGKIITDTWYFSTGLPIFMDSTIFALVMLFTKNWVIIRTIGTTLLLLLYQIAMYFFCKSIQIKNKAIVLSCILIPLSMVYFGMYTGMPYYVTTSIKVLAMLSIALLFINSDNSKHKKIVIIISAIVSFFVGLEGLRLFLYLYAPLMATSITILLIKRLKKNNINKEDKEVKTLLFSLVSFISFVIGYLIYHLILTKIFVVGDYTEVSFGTFTIAAIERIINSWLSMFGHTEGKFLSFALIHNVLSYILIFFTIFVTIYNIVKEDIKYEIRLVSFVLLFSILSICYSAIFFDFYGVDRYTLPIIILSYPLLVEFVERKTSIKLGRYILISVLIVMIVCGLHNLNLIRNNQDRSILKQINIDRVENDPIELEEIINELTLSGYKNGLSYFWTGNLMTELSNGNIEMWVLGPGGNSTNELTDINQIYKWLQIKDHEVVKPTDKTFIIVTQEELDYSKLAERLKWDNVIYNSEDYTVFGYNSYSELVYDFEN